MAPLTPTTYSWIALTTITPLVSLILTWAIISVHRKQRHHLKSILLLSILYSQLILQIFNFCHSTLNLLKLNSYYAYYLNYTFTTLILYKSLSVLSCHFEEFYKYKYPSNYLLNVNSSLLKYHLLVLFLLSLMGGYLFRGIEFVPLIMRESVDISGVDNDFASPYESASNSTGPSIFFVQPGDKLELVIVFLMFHAFVILSSLGFILVKYLILSKYCCNSASSSSSCSSLDINIIGTNSTTSSTNLYGGGGGGTTGNSNSELNSGSHHAHRQLHRHHKSVVQSRTITTVGIVNLIINLSLVACTFSNFWLPLLSLSSWPVSNIITWSQVIESILTPIVYSLVQIQSHHYGSGGGSGSKGKGGRSQSNCSGGSYASNGSVIYHHNGLRNNSAGQNNTRENHQLQQQHEYGAGARRNHQRHHHHELQYHNHRFPMSNGSLCFNNSEFQYFAGSKNAFASILNNASAYNTFDSSIHPAQSTYSKDSLRCASVTTIANDDFEFLSRRGEQLLHNNNGNNNIVAAAAAAASASVAVTVNCGNLNQIGGSQLETQPAQQSTITVASSSEQSIARNCKIGTGLNAGAGANAEATVAVATNLLAQYYQINNQNNGKSQAQHHNHNHYHNLNNHSFRQRTIMNDGELTARTVPSSSLSMNDLDLIAGDEDDDHFSNSSCRRLINDSSASSGTTAAAAGLLSSVGGLLSASKISSSNGNCNSNNVINKCKYKKNIKKRFSNSNGSNSDGCNDCCTNLNHSHHHAAHPHLHGANAKMAHGLRRVLSLESLHSHGAVNESHLAYLDTGERVIVFTTDYI